MSTNRVAKRSAKVHQIFDIAKFFCIFPQNFSPSHPLSHPNLESRHSIEGAGKPKPKTTKKPSEHRWR